MTTVIIVAKNIRVTSFQKKKSIFLRICLLRMRETCVKIKQTEHIYIFIFFMYFLKFTVQQRVCVCEDDNQLF